MRLTKQQKQIVASVVTSIIGEQVKVKLFGSRLDDNKKGGDIDLLVITSGQIKNPAWVIAKIQASLIMRLGERKIDVLLKAPNLQQNLIHEMADQEGEVLCG